MTSEPERSQLDVLVFGLGAIGSFYAFILGRAKRVRLTLCARSNYEIVKSDGLVIDSQNHGRHQVNFWKVIKTPAEAGMSFDYIVCANKAINQDAVPNLLKPVVDANRTTIVLAQNGVGNEDPFRREFPSSTIISCVVWIGAIQNTPGVVHHTKAENTQMGLFPYSTIDPSIEQTRLEEFGSLLVDGGSKIEIVPNIQVQRWEKVTWNAAWNPLTTLTMLDTHPWFASSENAIPLSRQVMKEMIDVARACGIPVAYGLIDILMDRIQGLASLGTSMQTDCRNGRVMEVDSILGYPVRKGRELGVQIPTIETLYALLQGINYRLARAVDT